MLTCKPHLRVEITPGFLLLMAGLFYLDRGIGILPRALLGCVIHEAGHTLAGAVVGGRIKRVGLSVVGAELHFEYPRVLSYGEENLITLAGPAANLLAGMLAMGLQRHLFAILCLGIGGFNLLPVLPLDGGRVLQNVLKGCLWDPWPERIMVGLTGVLAGVLLGIGVIVAVGYANVTLLMTSGWLLLKTLKIQDEKSK